MHDCIDDITEYELVAYMGWNEYSYINLAKNFIRKEDMYEAFLMYLREEAKEELSLSGESNE